MRLRLTGAAPDTAERRDLDRIEHSFDRATSGQIVTDAGWILGVHAFRMLQLQNSSCVGHGGSSGVAGTIAHRLGLESSGSTTPPAGVDWPSPMALWQGAVFRQRGARDTTRGTRLMYAVDELREGGWQPYVEGEEKHPERFLKQRGFDDAMFAHDKRSVGTEFRRIWQTGADRLDLLDAALCNRDRFVFGAWYLREAFFGIRSKSTEADVIADKSAFGDTSLSHCMRPFTRRVWKGRRVYGLQCFYRNHGGLHLPSGQYLPGCVWVDEAVIAEGDLCHDLMVGEPTV